MSRPVEPIVDAADVRLDPLRALPSQAEGNQLADRVVVVEGRAMLRRLLEAGWDLEVLAATPAHLDAIGELPPSTAVWRSSKSDLSQLLGFEFHRGCVGWARRPVTNGDELPKTGRRLIACGLADPRNLGALIRNAYAFGLQGVDLDAHCADPFSRLSVRSSVGWCFHVEIRRRPRLDDYLGGLRQAGWDLLGTSLHASSLAQGPAPLEPWALLIGSEAKGLSSEQLQRCSACFRIPTRASLNAATASAVMCAWLAQGR